MKKRTNADLIRQPKTGRKLSTKMFLFCQYYVTNGWNATQAAISAGYSERIANRQASENLTKPVIINQIEKVEREIEKTCNISKSMLVLEQKRIAFDRKATPLERQQAMKCLIDMLGYNKPILMDVNNTGNPSFIQLIRVDKSNGDVTMSEAEIKEKEGL